MRYVNCQSFSIQRRVGQFTGTPPQKESRVEFFKLWFENNLHRLRMDFRSIGFCKQTSDMQRKKGSKRIEMIIKMVNEFKLTVVHFARPNPMQICACARIYRWTKKLWKIRTGPRGLRAAVQPGRRSSGPRAAGPSGRRAVAGRAPRACV